MNGGAGSRLESVPSVSSEPGGFRRPAAGCDACVFICSRACRIAANTIARGLELGHFGLDVVHLPERRRLALGTCLRFFVGLH